MVLTAWPYKPVSKLISRPMFLYTNSCLFLVANVVHFNKDELLKVQAEFFKLAGKTEENKNMITRHQMEDTLKLVGIVESGKLNDACKF